MFLKITFIYVTLLLQITANKLLKQRQAGCDKNKMCQEIKAARQDIITMNNKTYERLDWDFDNLTLVLGWKTEQIHERLDEFKNQVDAAEEELWRKIKAATLPPSDCEGWLSKYRKSGVYNIKPYAESDKNFNAYCLMPTDSDSKRTGWTVIQRRQDGSVDFYRNWAEYQKGFGNLNSEYFLGLDNINAMTESGTYELWIQLEGYYGSKKWAKYSNFKIGNSDDKYILKQLGEYTGDARDAMIYHLNMRWTTFDNDNDGRNDNCAAVFKGAWWYLACHNGNLNGIYYKSYTEKDNGIVWLGHNGWMYSLKYVHMAIRRN